MSEISADETTALQTAPAGFTGDEDYWSSISRVCETIYPFLAVSGLFLNVLSLMVLVSKSMRGRTNLLLALIAIFDICFLVLLSLNMVMRYPLFIKNGNCKSKVSTGCMTVLYEVYVKYKGQLTACINFCSTTSTWLFVVVCSERLIAIKTPLKLHKLNSKYTLIFVISLILVCSALLTIFHNFAYSIVSDNNSSAALTGLNNGLHLMKPAENALYIQIAASFGVCFQVIIPILLLIVTNGLLLYYLRTRNRLFQVQKWNPSKNSFDFDENRNLNNQNNSNDSTRCSKIWSRRYMINERKVTITVFSIVCCFVITNFPSAVVFFWIYIIQGADFYKHKMDYAIVISCTIIVVSGKIANFFFLCHSSAYFRRQLNHKFLKPFKVFCKATPHDSDIQNHPVHFNKFRVQI